MNIYVKHIALILLFLGGYGNIKAQADSLSYENPYHEAIGIKIGNLVQLDYKLFLDIDVAMNASTGFYLGDRQGIFSSIVVTSHHGTHVENLFWYYGGGLAGRYKKDESQIGMATAVGFEVISGDKTVGFFIDIQPTAYLQKTTFSRTVELDYALAASAGVRYIFNFKDVPTF